MKRLSAFFACLLLAWLLPVKALAQWEPPFEVPAQEGYLVNLDTGQVVWEQNADEPHAIASLTKMMTALLLLESGEDLDTLVTIPARLEGEFQTIKDWDGAYLDLQTGEELRLRDLLYAMLLPSTNDAASAIADHLSQGNIPAFVEQMNAKAQLLGCESTQFSCPHGLYDAGNFSTAQDLARIAAACLDNEAFMEVVTTPSYWLPLTNLHQTPQTPDAPEGMYLELKSTIQLQQPESPLYRSYIRGLKTGFTDEAGRCLVTCARAEESYLLVLLGMPNEKNAEGLPLYFEYAARLLDWALAEFQVTSLPEEGTALTRLPLAYCEEADSVPLYPAFSLEGLLIEESCPPQYRFALPESLAAPLAQGQTVGQVEVWQGDALLGSVPLTVQKAYPYSARLYWKEKLTPYKAQILGGGGALLLLLLWGAARLRAALRRRARRRRRRAR